MTSRTEMRLLNKALGIMTVEQAIEHLQVPQRKLNNRRAENTTLALEHEIFRVEAEECNKILKELE